MPNINCEATFYSLSDLSPPTLANESCGSVTRVTIDNRFTSPTPHLIHDITTSARSQGKYGRGVGVQPTSEPLSGCLKEWATLASSAGVCGPIGGRTPLGIAHRDSHVNLITALRRLCRAHRLVDYQHRNGLRSDPGPFLTLFMPPRASQVFPPLPVGILVAGVGFEPTTSGL